MNKKSEKYLFLFPTKPELMPVIQRLKATPSHLAPNLYLLHSNGKTFFFLKCGIGKKNSIKTVLNIIPLLTPDLIISTGCCGGLKPYLGPGTLILPKQIYAGNGDSIVCDDIALFHAIGLRPSNALFSSRKPADRSRKLQIASQYNEAIGVDMESYWIIKTAQAHNITATALRSVVDALDTPIPVIGKKLGWYLLHPAQIVRRIQFARGTSRANSAIAEVIESLLKQ